MDAVIESSERLARAEIERWPDGVYRGESWMVSDGIDPTARYRIAVEITIAGSDITFDFSDTDDQAPGFTNMPPASALGAIRIAFLMLLNAGGIDVPTNQGLFAPITTVFREGSLLYPALPGLDDLRQPDVRRGGRVDHARARRAAARPRHAPAGTSSSAPRSRRSTRAPASPPSSLSIFMRGGPGAMRGSDGFDALGFSGTPGIDALARHGDVRALDAALHGVLRVPARLGRRGPLARRLGTTSSWRFYGEGELGVSIGDDAASEGADPAAGLFGGEPAGLNDLELHFPDGTMRNWGSKEIVHDIPVGTDLRRAQRRGRRLRPPART